IGTALQDLGLSLLSTTEGGDNVCYSIEHGDEDAKDEEDDDIPPEEQIYYVDTQGYTGTGAYYRFAVNQPGGALLAQYLLSPKMAAIENWEEDDPPEVELPKLSRASDIMWMLYSRDNPDPKKLKYYFVTTVLNDQTVPLIARMLRQAEYAVVPYWPGVTVSLDDEEGKVFLGSPMGATIAFLLAQYKAELGIKHITEVTIFRDNTPPDWMPDVNMLFKIEDVPEKTDTDDSHQALQTRGRRKNTIRVHRIWSR
ncbi:hypothetical protein P153DRAFT_298865, partial [Dothidotthia symphoricarpi CBS 119687]